MAQYEATSEQITTLNNYGELSDRTSKAIQALLDQNALVTVVSDSVTDKDTTSEGLYSEKNTSFGADDGSPAVFENVELAIIDEGASGNLNFNRENGVRIDVTDPAGLDVTITNDADNDILWHGGQASFTTGDGDNTMVVEGAMKGEIHTGSGDLDLTLDPVAQENAEISVDAGDGFDLMKLLGGSTKHSFSFKNGNFHMHSASVTMTGVNVVATDVNSDGAITLGTDHITILAANEHESLVAKLYKIALGREAIDGEDGWSKDGSGNTLGGLNWWINEFAKQSDNDGSIEHLYKAFLNCEEFHSKYDKMSNSDYVKALGKNMGFTDEDLNTNSALAAQFDDYVQKLNTGSLSREDVAYELAMSDQAVELLGTDGECYVINGF